MVSDVLSKILGHQVTLPTKPRSERGSARLSREERNASKSEQSDLDSAEKGAAEALLGFHQRLVEDERAAEGVTSGFKHHSCVDVENFDDHAEFMAANNADSNPCPRTVRKRSASPDAQPLQHPIVKRLKAICRVQQNPGNGHAFEEDVQKPLSSGDSPGPNDGSPALNAAGDSTFKQKLGQAGKSELTILCGKFQEHYGKPGADGKPQEIMLKDVALKLSTSRRRLYDIVNVLEAVEVVARTGKLTYRWCGLEHIDQLIQRLLQEDDDGFTVDERTRKTPRTANTDMEGKDAKWISHSLYGLSRKFVRLLLHSKEPVSLSDAAQQLGGKDNEREQLTIERRLYDIGSILSSVDLIEKKYMFRSGIKSRQPAFRWKYLPSEAPPPQVLNEQEAMVQQTETPPRIDVGVPGVAPFENIYGQGPYPSWLPMLVVDPKTGQARYSMPVKGLMAYGAHHFPFMPQRAAMLASLGLLPGSSQADARTHMDMDAAQDTVMDSGERSGPNLGAMPPAGICMNPFAAVRGPSWDGNSTISAAQFAMLGAGRDLEPPVFGEQSVKRDSGLGDEKDFPTGARDATKEPFGSIPPGRGTPPGAFPQLQSLPPWFHPSYGFGFGAPMVLPGSSAALPHGVPQPLSGKRSVSGSAGHGLASGSGAPRVAPSPNESPRAQDSAARGTGPAEARAGHRSGPAGSHPPATRESPRYSTDSGSGAPPAQTRALGDLPVWLPGPDPHTKRTSAGGAAAGLEGWRPGLEAPLAATMSAAPGVQGAGAARQAAWCSADGSLNSAAPGRGRQGGSRPDSPEANSSDQAEIAGRGRGATAEFAPALPTIFQPRHSDLRGLTQQQQQQLLQANASDFAQPSFPTLIAERTQSMRGAEHAQATSAWHTEWLARAADTPFRAPPTLDLPPAKRTAYGMCPKPDPSCPTNGQCEAYLPHKLGGEQYTFGPERSFETGLHRMDVQNPTDVSPHGGVEEGGLVAKFGAAVASRDANIKSAGRPGSDAREPVPGVGMDVLRNMPPAAVELVLRNTLALQQSPAAMHSFLRSVLEAAPQTEGVTDAHVLRAAISGAVHAQSRADAALPRVQQDVPAKSPTPRRAAGTHTPATGRPSDTSDRAAAAQPAARLRPSPSDLHSTAEPLPQAGVKKAPGTRPVREARDRYQPTSKGQSSPPSAPALAPDLGAMAAALKRGSGGGSTQPTNGANADAKLANDSRPSGDVPSGYPVDVLLPPRVRNAMAQFWASAQNGRRAEALDALHAAASSSLPLLPAQKVSERAAQASPVGVNTFGLSQAQASWLEAAAAASAAATARRVPGDDAPLLLQLVQMADGGGPGAAAAKAALADTLPGLRNSLAHMQHAATAAAAQVDPLPGARR